MLAQITFVAPSDTVLLFVAVIGCWVGAFVAFAEASFPSGFGFLVASLVILSKIAA